MKNTLLNTIGGIALAVLFLTMSAPVSVSGQNGGGRLVGTWDVQVTIRSCQTDVPVRTFPSLMTYMQGGTMLDSTSGIPQALKTPGHGGWSHINGNTYKSIFKSFSFDPVGNFTGWTILRHEIRLNSGATEGELAGTAEVYNANGVLVLTGCSSATATRLE
jgi:hypothetical protein